MSTGIEFSSLFVSKFNTCSIMFHLSMLPSLTELAPILGLLLTSTLHGSFFGLETAMHTFCFLQITRKQTNHQDLAPTATWCNAWQTDLQIPACPFKATLQTNASTAHGSCHFSSPLGLWFCTVSALVPSHLELDFFRENEKTLSVLCNKFSRFRRCHLSCSTMEATHGTVGNPTRK